MFNSTTIRLIISASNPVSDGISNCWLDSIRNTLGNLFHHKPNACLTHSRRCTTTHTNIYIYIIYITCVYYVHSSAYICIHMSTYMYIYNIPLVPTISFTKKKTKENNISCPGHHAPIDAATTTIGPQPWPAACSASVKASWRLPSSWTCSILLPTKKRVEKARFWGKLNILNAFKLGELQNSRGGVCVCVCVFSEMPKKVVFWFWCVFNVAWIFLVETARSHLLIEILRAVYESTSRFPRHREMWVPSPGARCNRIPKITFSSSSSAPASPSSSPPSSSSSNDDNPHPHHHPNLFFGISILHHWLIFNPWTPAPAPQARPGPPWAAGLLPIPTPKAWNIPNTVGDDLLFRHRPQIFATWIGFFRFHRCL